MLLTIAIPTYNRAHHLLLLVDFFRNEFSSDPGLRKYVTLLVSDNCSTDETQKVCERYYGLPWLKIIRQSRNEGLEGQYLFFEKCITTDYMWIHGDDDYTNPGTLRALIDILIKHRPYMVSLNASSSHLNPFDTAFYPASMPDIIVNKSVEEALDIIKDNIQYISSHVLLCSSVRGAFSCAYQHGLNCIHIYAHLVALQGQSIILPHVHVFSKPSSILAHEHNWVDMFWKRPANAIKLYSKECRPLVYSKMPRFFFRQDCQFIRSQVAYTHYPQAYIPTFGDIFTYIHSPFFKLLAISVLLLPNWSIALLIKVKRRFMRRPIRLG